MPDLVKIPLSAAEYQARCERPYIGFIGREREHIAAAIVDVLLPFGFRLVNSDAVAVGNFAKHKIILKLPERGITIQRSLMDTPAKDVLQKVKSEETAIFIF